MFKLVDKEILRKNEKVYVQKLFTGTNALYQKVLRLKENTVMRVYNTSLCVKKNILTLRQAMTQSSQQEVSPSSKDAQRKHGSLGTH